MHPSYDETIRTFATTIARLRGDPSALDAMIVVDTGGTGITLTLPEGMPAHVRLELDQVSKSLRTALLGLPGIHLVGVAVLADLDARGNTSDAFEMSFRGSGHSWAGPVQDARAWLLELRRRLALLDGSPPDAEDLAEYEIVAPLDQRVRITASSPQEAALIHAICCDPDTPPETSLGRIRDILRVFPSRDWLHRAAARLPS